MIKEAAVSEIRIVSKSLPSGFLGMYAILHYASHSHSMRESRHVSSTPRTFNAIQKHVPICPYHLRAYPAATAHCGASAM
jgi:hypothetical protein